MPTTLSRKSGRTVRFSATVTGSSNTQVSWQVNDIPGGNPAIGTISSLGVYVAPRTVPSPATVTVKAVSGADPTRSGAATVTVVRK